MKFCFLPLEDNLDKVLNVNIAMSSDLWGVSVLVNQKQYD